ncbi:hypothetical protein AB0P32_03740 [Streptomyces sp. NPDC085995]|uniref:hypothetical protein n=1 Tax=Streptomyces sp. NPDC085995 TaxID=3154861 RepID=UPI00341E0931
MSYGLAVYKFTEGELAAPDIAVVRALLAPYRAALEEDSVGDTDFWIRAADGGEAEISVVDDIISIERPSPGQVKEIIAELANRLRAGILTPRGSFLFREDCRAHLPEGLEADAVFVTEITREALESVEPGAK